MLQCNTRHYAKRRSAGSLAAFCSLVRARDGGYGHITSGGIEERIDSTLPPVRRPKIVPRS